MEEDYVFACGFCSEEGFVGAGHELLEGVGVPGEGGESAGDGDFALDVAGFGPLVGFDGFAESFGGEEHVAGVFGVGLAGRFVVPIDDGEFVAAETGDEVVGTGAGAEEFDEFADDGVAGGMAEAVVVLFEVVDVEEEEGDAESVEACAFEEAGDEFIEVAAIVGTGEFISDGHGAELLIAAPDAEERSEPMRGPGREQLQRRGGVGGGWDGFG